MKDEILEELWKIKDRIAIETNYNTHALFERLKKVQTEFSNPVVDRTNQREKQAI